MQGQLPASPDVGFVNFKDRWSHGQSEQWISGADEWIQPKREPFRLSCIANSYRYRSAMTDWEARYQAGDMPWEKGSAAPPLLELLEKTERAFWGDGAVLVPGCGFGHDARALAAAGLQVQGVDLSPTAVAKAKAFMPVGKEIYQLGNFLDPDWQSERDISSIWEHTCLCAINPSQRPAYVAAAARILPPGGILAGVFFLNPFDAGEDRTGPPFGATLEELESLFSPWFEKVDGWVPQQAYPGRESREWIGIFRRGF
jgi:SAM-dependent methyltransferase